MKKRLTIEGMTCMHCQMRVKKALDKVEGLEEVTVNLEGGYADIEGADVEDALLKDTVEDAGYDVTAIEELQ